MGKIRHTLSRLRVAQLANSIMFIALLSLNFGCGGPQKDPIGSGSKALKQGDLDTALECAQDAISQHPEQRQALELMARVHRVKGDSQLSAGNLDAALKSFETSAKYEPSRKQRAQDWSKAAELALDMGFPEDATRLGEAAIKADPTSLEMRRFVGNLHDESGASMLAISHYLYVWEADREDLNLGLRLAQLYVTQKRPEDAVVLFQTILDQDKSNAQALLGLAESYENLGELDSAKRLFKRAIRAHKSNPGLMYRYADFLDRTGNVKTATQWRKKAEKALPGVKRRRMRKLK